MTPPRSSNAGTVRTVNHQPLKKREILGPYDASVSAVGPQVLGKARFEGAPRVPPAAATRKHTPVRPVYNDFETAHSSITSGSANGRSRDMSYKSPNRTTGLLDRGHPLSRRTLKSLRRQKKQPKYETLVIPKPAKVSHNCHVSQFDFDISDANSTSGRQDEYNSLLGHSPNMASQKIASVSPFLDNLKKAIGGKPSPVTKPFQSRLSLSFKWPRDSMELSGLARKIDQSTKESEHGQTDARSHHKSDNSRLPELPLSIKDPFMYEANQNTMSVERIGTGHNDAVGDRQHNLESINFQDNQNPGEMLGASHDKPLVQTRETLGYFHGGIALAIDSQGTLSPREGSTVDNIVKQYARNNGLWDISLDSNDEDSEDENGYFQHFKMQKRVQNGVLGCSASGISYDMGRGDQPEGDIVDEKPFRAIKLMNFSGRAPSTALPHIPTLADQGTLKGSSEGLGQSTSYGDTRNLLDITQRSECATATGRPNFKAGAAPHSTWTGPSNTNSFRHGSNQNLVIPSIAAADRSPNSQSSQKMVPDASVSTERLADIPLLALERDVSRALRRMSAFSNASQEISAHYQGDGGFQSSSDSSGLLSFIGRPTQRVPEPLKLVTPRFYHESAIRQTWLDSQCIERVRIPIRRNLSVSSSLPVSHSASSATDEFDLEEVDGFDQNGTEWETVVDGVVSRVKTAGSSLANNSSTGNISPILYEHNDFSSTDRIVQHPAQIEYSHDYRYREIKEGNFPVLLPSYKPHTVNGFPANSYRSLSPFQQSPGDLYQPPPPLSIDHTNPFRSPPPEVITNKPKSSEALDQDRFILGPPSKLILGTHSQSVNGAHSDNWMDESSDPGPAVRITAPTNIVGVTHKSTYSLSESDSRSGSEIVGSSAADASFSTLSTIIHESKNLQGVRKDGASKFKHAAGNNDNVQHIAREQAPFIKRPPGAFYQGVRSRPDPGRKGFSSDRKNIARVPERKAAQNYPTNQMRPLSLVQAQRADPAAVSDKIQPGGRSNDNFLYRSPLAPIKSRSWCNLYTKEQLNSMHKNARIDSINDFEHMPRISYRPAFGEALRLDGSWKRTWSPHLRPWPRDNSSIKTDLSGQKVKISSLIFGLCCLFPPMLVLYGVGYLDNMMLWITHGEISSFSKAHKKAALRVVCFFIIAILIAVPIIVAVNVIGSK